MSFVIVCSSLLLGAYIVSGALLYRYQNQLLYQPAREVSGLDLETLIFEVDDLSLRVYKTNPGGQEGNRPAIIYYGGNAEAVEENAVFFNRHFADYVVYLAPYRSYSGNPGVANESDLYHDALAIFDELAKKHDTVILMGRSLGSAIAVYVAVKKTIAALILVTPFDSVENLPLPYLKFFPKKYLLTQKYLSWTRVSKLNIPTLVLIAEHDEIIPRANVENLLTHFNQCRPEEKIIQDSSHNTISFKQSYLDTLREFLERQLR